MEAIDKWCVVDRHGTLLRAYPTWEHAFRAAFASSRKFEIRLRVISVRTADQESLQRMNILNQIGYRR